MQDEYMREKLVHFNEMLCSYPELDKESVQILQDNNIKPSGQEYFKGKEKKFENF